MGDLLIRRRGLILPSSPTSDIIYELSTPMVFDGTTAVDTGVYLLGNYSNGTAPSFSIVVDGTPTNVNGDKYFFAARCEALNKLMFNFSTYSNGNAYTAWFASSNSTSTGSWIANKYVRVVLTYEQGGGATYTWLREGGTLKTKSYTTPTGAVITGAATGESVKIGASAFLGSNGRFVGTISLFRIYNRKLTDTEVSDFFANGTL